MTQTSQNRTADKLLKCNWWESDSHRIAFDHALQLQDLPSNWDAIEAENCYFFDFIPNCTPVSKDQFGDLTGWECFYNKLHLDDYLLGNYTPKDCFLAGIQMMKIVGVKLAAKFPEKPFKLFLSYDEEYTVLRFHLVRPQEAFLTENLEEYENEGVLVMRI